MCTTHSSYNEFFFAVCLFLLTLCACVHIHRLHREEGKTDEFHAKVAETRHAVTFKLKAALEEAEQREAQAKANLLADSTNVSSSKNGRE